MDHLRTHVTLFLLGSRVYPNWSRKALRLAGLPQDEQHKLPNEWLAQPSVRIQICSPDFIPTSKCTRLSARIRKLAKPLGISSGLSVRYPSRPRKVK